MKELGEKIVSYWGNRAEGYSEYNREELAGDKWQDWIAEIKKQLPKKEKSEIRILDIGTGTGFFAFLLSSLGHRVTGIDLTPSMIQEAKEIGQTHCLSDFFFVLNGSGLSLKLAGLFNQHLGDARESLAGL